MKGFIEYNLKEHFVEALTDETVFILRDRRQKKNNSNETELRCECRPLCYMTGKMIREILENIDNVKAIKNEE